MTKVLKDKVLAALVEHENDKPRSKQLRLGPSELGGCREYIRNIMIGTPRQHADTWPAAAVVGGLIGKHVEDVLHERRGTLSEVPVRTSLPNGLQVVGHADTVWIDEDAVIDVKSKNELHDVLRNGASLDNLIQISVYRLGLVQAGVLTENSTAHLIYVDRSGQQQFLHEIVLTHEEMEGYIELCMQRLDEVLEAQEAIEEGNTELVHDLRDKTPPFCYSERVLCPFRDNCWKGSEWVPHEEINDAEVNERVRRFVEARALQDEGTKLRRELREQLIGVSGVTPDGYSVKWAGDDDRPALYVTKVK